ncbi:MAG TPA: hypothetical protein VI172_03385 [Candidatus Dormibacteraeota bacterium]
MFDAGTWYSQDGKFQWDGSAWIRSSKPRETVSPAHIGFAVVFVAVIGYAVYTMVSTDSAFALGVYFGAIAFFGVLLIVFFVAGRWGWFGAVVRVLSVGLALLKIVTLIAHPPSA